MALKRLIFWIAILSPFLIFIDPYQFKEFSKIGWNILVGVMLIRPLADIFSKIGILRTLVALRKEFGIGAALLFIAHFVGFILLNNVSVFDVVLDARYWNFKMYIAWGLLGITVSLPILLTSNKFAIIHLKKWWKPIQKLSYLLFIVGGIHIFLIGKKDVVYTLLFVAIIWLIAKIKVIYARATT